MALKLTQRLQLLGQAGAAHAYLAFGLRRISGHRVSAGSAGQKCVASLCLWARPFGSCRFHRHRCLELQQHGCVYDRRVSTIVREPSFLTTSSVGLHRDPGLRFRLTVLHRPTDAEFLAFRERLANCVSSRQVFGLMGTVEILSDTMGAAALHRVADLEASDSSLKNPVVLEHDAVRTLCFQLEQDSGRLTDEGLVSALLACTRLYLDPWSTLVVRLVSESQERLDAGRMSVGQLCTLGRAMLALEGSGCGMLEQVMEQVQRRTPAEWSLDDLMAVYGLLQGGLGECGHYQKLLNHMNARAMSATSSMDPAAVSGLLDALVLLDQTQAMPLVINLCKQAVKHVPHFSDDELTAVLGALMHFGHSDYHFVAAMERHVPKMAFTSHAETVTQVMQYFGQRNILSVPVFDAVAESFVYRADEYTTSQLAGQIIPFGKLGYLPPNAGQMFRKVEANLHARFSQFQPRTLLNLLHACILVQRFPVNFVSKVFSSYFLQQLQEEGSGIDRINLAQLTQLYMTVKLECPSYDGPRLLSKYRVKTFLLMGRSLETPVDGHLYHRVKNGLVHLLGARSYFASSVLTPYCYTIDVEIKLDEEGFVQPASYNEEVYKRIALCIDGQRRFTTNTRQLLGMEAIKQRHLRLLGYEVVQIPFFEFEKLQSQTDIIEYLHKKIFPQSYRLSW